MKLRQLRTTLLLVAACAAAFGDTVVVPIAQATAPGNLPIAIGDAAVHTQEIIGSGQFTGPITILALRVRSAPGKGRVNLGTGSLQLTLSTTQAYPNTNNGHALPSPTYANNVGPDAVVVYNGLFTASSPGCQPPGPCPFDMVIPFTIPFSYDPSKGRLLIDLVGSASAGSTGSLDGVGFPDSTSSTIALVAGDPTKPTGDLNLAGIVYGLETGLSASPYSVVIPGSLTSTEGDSLSTASGLFGSAAGTVQFQITAAELALLGLNKGDQIMGVQTRLNGGVATAPAADIAVSALDVTFAEAALAIGSMSNTFVTNMKNPVLVRSGGFTIPAGSMPGGGTPNAFGTLVSFTTPYTYQGGDLIFMYTKSAASTMTTDAANLYTGVGTAYRTLLIGSYQAVTGNLGTGIAPFKFEVTPKFGNKNSASYEPKALAADMIGFGETTGIAAATVVAPAGPWPFTLGGAHLDIVDSKNQLRQAPVYFVATNSMGYLLPARTALGLATARLTTSTGATVTGTINVVPVAPGLYAINSTGSGVAAGLFIHADASGAQSSGFLFSLPNLDPAPVDLGPPGDVVFLQLYGTGFRGASQATATVGGTNVPVYGFAAVGVYQGEDVINIGPLPRSLAGRGQVDIVVNFDGKLTNTVTASIR